MNWNNIVHQLWDRLRGIIDLSDYIDVDAAAESIRTNVRFRGPNIIILFCAIVIASVGLNVNSIPVIIGAMLVSPLMSPIMGMGLALGTNDTDLLRSSLKNLGIMVGISILASSLYFLVSPLDMEHPTELLARTNPTIYDVLIALFGGFAGIVEVSRKEKGTVVVGVAIATALMPPLCTVGYGIATLNSQFFFGALYLFFINLTFIALAALVGTKYLGYKQVKVTNPATQRRNKIVIAVFLTALIVPSILSGITVIKENNFTRNANAFVAANKSLGKSYIYDHRINCSQVPNTIELYIAGEALSTEDYAMFYTSAEKFGLNRDQLLFHEDAAYRNQSINENEMVRDLLHMNEEKLQARMDEIAVLNNKVDSLQQIITAQQLPAYQLSSEICTQYAMVETAELARTSDGAILVVLSLYDGKHMTATQRQAITNWLAIRLQSANVRVIINN